MAKRFIIDDATGALYEDFTARRVVSAADILEAEGGASETIQVFLVTHNPQTRAVATTAIATANVSLDIGVPGASPTAGKVIVSYGGESTAEIPVTSLTADSLGAAMNRLDAIESDGGVDVWAAGDPGQLNFYMRLQNTGAPGTNPSIDTDGTTPPSSAEVTVITAGSSSERALWLVQIAEAPVASIAESAWSTVTSGSFGGLTAALSLNGKGLLAHLAKDNPPPLTMTVKNSSSVLMRGTIPAFQAVDPSDLNGSAIISIFPRIVTSTSNPTTGDDSGDGYAVGTVWLNTSTTAAWILMDSTEGAAGWTELTEVTGGYATTGQLASYLPLAGGTMTGAVNTQDINLKDSDVAHGVTNVAATDAYGNLAPIHGTQGGLYINGISDQESASARSLALRGICNDTHTDAIPTVEIIGAKRSGTSVQALADAETILTVANHTTDRLTMLGNGNSTFTGQVNAAGGTQSASVTFEAGAVMEGNIDMDGNKATDLAAGSASTDSINKGQLDTVSTVASAALPKAGGTMAGAIAMGSSKVTGLAEGAANGDALRFEQLRTIKNDNTTTAYTLVVGDATKTVRINNASTHTLTVPKSVFIAGDTVTLFRKGAGGVTIEPVDGDVTINSVGTKRKLASQYSAATLICVTGGATPEFDLIGDLTA